LKPESIRNISDEKMITPEDRNQLEHILTRTPESIWGYIGFILPMAVIAIGIIVNVLLVMHFKTKAPIEIVLRCDGEITSLWSNDLIRSFMLTTSLCIVTTGGLLALLAHTCLRQKQLLQKIMREMRERDADRSGE
jgi:hypothetical protein